MHRPKPGNIHCAKLVYILHILFNYNLQYSTERSGLKCSYQVTPINTFILYSYLLLIFFLISSLIWDFKSTSKMDLSMPESVYLALSELWEDPGVQVCTAAAEHTQLFAANFRKHLNDDWNFTCPIMQNTSSIIWIELPGWNIVPAHRIFCFFMFRQ